MIGSAAFRASRVRRSACRPIGSGVGRGSPDPARKPDRRSAGTEPPRSRWATFVPTGVSASPVGSTEGLPDRSGLIRPDRETCGQAGGGDPSGARNRPQRGERRRLRSLRLAGSGDLRSGRGRGRETRRQQDGRRPFGCPETRRRTEEVRSDPIRDVSLAPVHRNLPSVRAISQDSTAAGPPASSSRPIIGYPIPGRPWAGEVPGDGVSPSLQPRSAGARRDWLPLDGSIPAQAARDRLGLAIPGLRRAVHRPMGCCLPFRADRATGPTLGQPGAVGPV